MRKDTGEVAQQMTPFMQEEVRAASGRDQVLAWKIIKLKAEIADDVTILQLPPNSEVDGLLTALKDWISDEHLSKLQRQEESKDGQKPQSAGRTHIQEKVEGLEFALLHMFSDSQMLTPN
ncbi:coiled-coil domain-containing protein 138-like isoform X2 [Coturnix japonica]|uniref:coiled-coil domain-containing protein 138-like isoform X2 n=1 Tax=Coturnix japonica TaxID=93934 RepID=UPI000776E133|nr:coiled-coil domain-containing protein 138-like isoform X2 [Coturnix japonica]